MKADSVVLRLIENMEMKRAKRELSGLRLCADSVYWRT
jgi:hypothetical protein